MKCPKCKKEMMKDFGGSAIFGSFKSFICRNKKCLFYGIERKLYKEDLKNDS